MTLDEFKKQQKRALKDFQAKVARGDKTQAASEARERLQSARILDKNGKLVSRYR